MPVSGLPRLLEGMLGVEQLREMIMRLSQALLGSVALVVFCVLFNRTSAAQDYEGCSDSPLVNRFPNSHIDGCQNKEYEQADFPLPAGADGNSVSKHLEGEYHEAVYITQPGISPIQLFRNFQNALRAAQFTFDYTNSPEELVGHKGNTWIYLIFRDESYEQIIVTLKDLQQDIKVDAAGLGDELNKSGQVAIYGIHFDTGKAILKPDSDSVLGEIVKLMQQNLALKLKVEGHTDNQGTAASNQTLSQKRADAVVAWLTAHGINASRLSPVGRGQSAPLADNSTDAGRAQNRRVELVKN
jgi:OmpA-OmpF porin, OOP family